MTTSRGRGLSDEPFFAVVRERHPDIDIVVLPPETASEEPAVRVSATEARRLRREAEESLRVLWPLVAEGLQADDGSLLTGWRGISDVEVEAQASQRSSSVPETKARAVLGSAAANLHLRSWRVHELEGGAPRLVGHKDGLTVEVTWWPVHAYDVAVRTEALPVGADVSRELMAGDRR